MIVNKRAEKYTTFFSNVTEQSGHMQCTARSVQSGFHIDARVDLDDTPKRWWLETYGSPEPVGHSAKFSVGLLDNFEVKSNKATEGFSYLVNR